MNNVLIESFGVPRGLKSHIQEK